MGLSLGFVVAAFIVNFSFVWRKISGSWSEFWFLKAEIY